MEMGVRNLNIVIKILFFLPYVFMFPDQGQWTESYEKVTGMLFGMPKTLYSGSYVSLTVNCEPHDSEKKIFIEISWILRQTSCFEEYLSLDILSDEALQMLHECPMNSNGKSKVRYHKSEPIHVECSSLIRLEPANSSFFTNADNIKNSLNSRCAPNDAFNIKSSSTDSIHLPTNEVKPLEENMKKNFKTRAIDVKEINEYEGKFPRHAIRVKKQVGDKDSNIPSSLNNTLGTTKSDNINEKHVESQTVPESETVSNPAPFIDSYNKKLNPGSKLILVDIDGVYLFILKIQSITKELIDITVDVSMKSDYGYLSAVDYPLLLFYGYMCGIYAIYAFSWLVVSAMQWRDLLRIQFWIGGVIFLGLIEKAVFYAEYQSINYTGQSVQGAVIFAEILSCLKRTLARMLVIIVSLGFGIVKPRLGPMLHRVVGVGALYFILGAAEGCLRVLKPKNDPSNQALMAGIPLAVTDSAICWWIFSSLVQTNRTLRLRRNLVKLSLYRHFTNTLIFAVLASVAYMVWSIHSHKLVTCVTDWKELWIDEAYWHLLFSLLLLVIMILWRPTNNNQRYAYTPLLDAMDDDNEDDFDQNVTNDAFAGMKMRASKNPVPQNEKDIDQKQDDDLKWVEENVPSTFTETAVPTFLDSDEEIMTAKFERSKME